MKHIEMLKSAANKTLLNMKSTTYYLLLLCKGTLAFRYYMIRNVKVYINGPKKADADQSIRSVIGTTY